MILAVGAVSNAWRGGQIKIPSRYASKIPSWVPERKSLPNDPVNAAAFAITMALVTGVWLVALPAFILMWIGAAPGWGAYIGAMVDGSKPEKEVLMIDDIIKPWKNNPRAWGFAGLTLRGTLWGFTLAVCASWFSFFAAAMFVVAGATMGVVYDLSHKFVRAFGKNKKWRGLSGWQFSEYTFGAVLWLPLYFV